MRRGVNLMVGPHRISSHCRPGRRGAAYNSWVGSFDTGCSVWSAGQLALRCHGRFARPDDSVLGSDGS